MEDHVNWPPALGTKSLINDGWYKVYDKQDDQ